MKKFLLVFSCIITSIVMYSKYNDISTSNINGGLLCFNENSEISFVDDSNELPCGVINGFKIYDQLTDSEVPGIGFLFQGMVIDFNDLPLNYYIAVETTNIESVQISVDAVNFILENLQPYTYPSGAEMGTNWNGGPGEHFIDASGYEFDNATNLCSVEYLSFLIYDPACLDDIDCDGVIDADDCAPNDAMVYEGALCDDGDSATENDVIREDCSCIGTDPLTHFVTTWKTDNLGTSNNSSITIPTYQGITNPEVYNYDVDWNNDGIFDDLGLTNDITHDYGVAGIYTIRIRGDFPRIYFNNQGDINKILNVDQWGNVEWTSMARAFWGCSNLGSDSLAMASDSPNFSGVTSMNAMFLQASSFNQNIGSWNVSNVTDMSYLFGGAILFNQDISSWNVSNVTKMNVLFQNARAFNQDINSWNVSQVTDMSFMFNQAISFNQNIGGWNVINVTAMRAMFQSANSFNQDIGSWDISNLTDMRFMFGHTDLFNQDISSWNVNSVNNMRGTFVGATSFNQDIGSWNVSNVNDMSYLFSGSSSFDQNIGSWNVGTVSDMTNMFLGTTLSTQNYDSLLMGWSEQELVPGINFHGGNSLYCEGSTARQSIIENFGWSIEDGGVEDIICLETCPTDFDGNGITKGDDFRIFQGNYWLTCDSNCPTDLNSDGITNGEDFAIFLANFGLSCD